MQKPLFASTSDRLWQGLSAAWGDHSPVVQPTPPHNEYKKGAFKLWVDTKYRIQQSNIGFNRDPYCAQNSREYPDKQHSQTTFTQT